MSSYEMLGQNPPTYGQPAAGYQQQPAANVIQHHGNRFPDPPSYRTRDSGNDTDDEAAGDGPGDIPDKALDLDFDKCFYEHKSTKTFPELHMCIGLVYKYTKLVIYHIFVVLFGVPMAVIWAVLNSIMVFLLVWLYQPLLRMIIMLSYAISPLVSVPLQAIYTPLIDAHARIFRQIRIKAKLDGSFAERLAGVISQRQVHAV